MNIQFNKKQIKDDNTGENIIIFALKSKYLMLNIRKIEVYSKYVCYKINNTIFNNYCFDFDFTKFNTGRKCDGVIYNTPVEVK